MMVKLYFTAGIIFDALKVFENYDDSLAQQAKFAKWRSTHIHTSLQKGEMPTPPKPREGEADDAALMAELDPWAQVHTLNQQPRRLQFNLLTNLPQHRLTSNRHN